MEEVNRTPKLFFEGKLWWVLGIVIICAVIWFWVSWRQGVFPFSSEVTAVTSSVKMEQPLSKKSVLDSLTAPIASSTSVKPDIVVLKNLTTSKTNAKTVDNAAVLESLTPKK